MIIKTLLEKSIEGTGKHGRTSIFPCGIFQYSKEINGLPGTPNYDLYKLALKSTAQRLYPNYVNIDWSNQKDWIENDRKQKQEFIDSLSKEDYDKLIERIENNPELSNILNIEIIEK